MANAFLRKFLNRRLQWTKTFLLIFVVLAIIYAAIYWSGSEIMYADSVDYLLWSTIGVFVITIVCYFFKK